MRVGPDVAQVAGGDHPRRRGVAVLDALQIWPWTASACARSVRGMVSGSARRLAQSVTWLDTATRGRRQARSATDCRRAVRRPRGTVETASWRRRDRRRWRATPRAGRAGSAPPRWRGPRVRRTARRTWVRSRAGRGRRRRYRCRTSRGPSRGCRRRCRGWGGGPRPHPVAAADPHQPLRLEDPQRLTQRLDVDRVLLAQLGLLGQDVALGEIAAQDALADLVGDHLGQPAPAEVARIDCAGLAVRSLLGHRVTSFRLPTVPPRNRRLSSEC